MNYQLLNKWVAKTIADHPEIFTGSREPMDVYVKLYDIWLPEIQLSLKEIIKQVMKQPL